MAPVEVCDELLLKVIDLFLTIRSHTFTNGFVEKIQTIEQKGYAKIKSIEKKKLF